MSNDATPLTTFQIEVARVFFDLPASRGFLLAGGAALLAQHLTARPTRDLDFFTRPGAGDVPRARDEFVAAATARGWTVEPVQDAGTFSRLRVHGREDLIVDIALDSPPGHPPAASIAGPTFAPEELAGRKVIALFDRAAARDFIDVFTLGRQFTKAELLERAAEIDPGFDTEVFADMIDNLARYSDTDLALGVVDIDNVRGVLRGMGRRPPFSIRQQVVTVSAGPRFARVNRALRLSSRFMGRPPLPVGTFGRIDFHCDGERRVRARASFRDVDGVRRPVTRWGSSAEQAETRLRAALTRRAGPTVGALSAQTRVVEAARAWLAHVDGCGRAPETRSSYRSAVRGYVVPAMGELRLGELTVPLIEHALAAVLAGHGPGAARTARAALSGICSMAARHGALPTNPVRDTAPIRQGRKPVRALTVSEAADLQARLRRDPRARRLDLPDLVEFMLATGTRIGEAAAMRDAVVDLTARTVTVNATVIRVPAVGLRLQPHPKTAAAYRTLALPAHVVAMLRRRASTRRTNAAGTVFCSPAGMIRDPSNTQADLREVLDRIGYGWVTSHTFRKTVATRLDEAGMSARQIADHLGHARPSMTLDVYLGRMRSVNRAAAAVLDQAAAGREVY